MAPLNHSDSDVGSKPELTHLEVKHTVDAERASQDVFQDIDDGFDPAFVKRTMRKVDWRLLPILCAMYCVSLIDRTNLSIARQANNRYMDKELVLVNTKESRYSIITVVFFVPYIIFEMPSQFGLRKFGAKWWLSSAVFLWGIVMLCMGFVKTWTQLAALRAVLGFFEAALFPGAAYLISCWYPRRSMATRNVVFYMVSSVVGSFASPLAYCFTLLHGRGGFSGWSLVFIFFGIITIVVGIVGYVALVDIPSKATFLSEEERHFIATRIERDRKDSEPDAMTWAKIGKYCLEWRIWMMGFFFMSTTVASYSQAYFMPVILQSMGFKNIETMVLGAPPSAYALIPAFVTGYIADKYRHCRAWVIVFNATCLIAGTAMYSQLPMSKKAARFAGVFIAVGGASGNVPLVISWAQTSIRGYSKRAFTAALIVAWGGIGGILAGSVFIDKEAYTYPTGIRFTMGVNACTILGVIFLHFWFRHQNKKADQGLIVIEDDPDFRFQG